MYKENHLFHTPENDTVVWRYIDFTKFVDLITSSNLFFCRSDKFDDPYEGMFLLKDYDETKNMLQGQELTKKFYFLNCWHINNNQSDAMWKIFLDTKNGIAIKTTVGKIIKSLEKSKDNIYISKIYYRDYNKSTFTELMFEPQNNRATGRGGSVSQFNYKRISFEHEKELRLFYIDMPIPHAIKNGIQREPLDKKLIKADINELIGEIVIAPFADAWFQEMVKKLLCKLKLNFKITHSGLYELKD